MANKERRRIIAVLEEVRQAADRGGHVEYTAEDRPRLQVAFELKEADCIRGGNAMDSQGRALQSHAIGLTTKGRQYLDELRAKEHEEGLRGRTRRVLDVIFGAAVAGMITLLFEFLRGWMRGG